MSKCCYNINLSKLRTGAGCNIQMTKRAIGLNVQYLLIIIIHVSKHDGTWECSSDYGGGAYPNPV